MRARSNLFTVLRVRPGGMRHGAKHGAAGERRPRARATDTCERAAEQPSRRPPASAARRTPPARASTPPRPHTPATSLTSPLKPPKTLCALRVLRPPEFSNLILTLGFNGSVVAARCVPRLCLIRRINVGVARCAARGCLETCSIWKNSR